MRNRLKENVTLVVRQVVVVMQDLRSGLNGGKPVQHFLFGDVITTHQCALP